MSKIVTPWGESSYLSALKRGDTIPGVPYTTMWWRQRLYPNDSYIFAMTEVDDVDNPTQVTVTWNDVYGPNDDVIRPYAAHVSHEELHRSGPYGSLDSLDLLRQVWYLDVLWYEPPTGGRWLPLTSPGRHIHPNDHEAIREVQRQQFANLLSRRYSSLAPPNSAC